MYPGYMTTEQMSPMSLPLRCGFSYWDKILGYVHGLSLHVKKPMLSPLSILLSYPFFSYSLELPNKIFFSLYCLSPP